MNDVQLRAMYEQINKYTGTSRLNPHFNAGYKAGFKAACEWRDSQVLRTTEDDPCPACRPNTVCRTPSCGRLKGKRQEPITLPAAQINQQMNQPLVHALEQILEWAGPPTGSEFGTLNRISLMAGAALATVKKEQTK